MTNSLPLPLMTVPTAPTTTLSPYQHLRLHLQQLRLSHMLTQWESVEHQAMQEQWSYAKFLLTLCELETNRRNDLRRQRGLTEAQLPAGSGCNRAEVSLACVAPSESFSNFDFAHCPGFKLPNCSIFLL
jgi:DNA replication protein DnaC